MARIVEPFEIQTLTIPDALLGHDILGRAPTGSGKTLAFGLPALARLAPAEKKRPKGLILSPTRELAEQIARELEPLAYAVDRNLLAIYGGKGLTPQVKALRQGVDLLIACPGRLLDLVNQRALSLEDVEIAIVDEADRMADMGFLPDVRRILDMTNENRQTVLFSATLDNDVKVLVDKYQTDPIEHAVAELEPDLSVMEHRFIRVAKNQRLPYLADIIDDVGQTVVFVRTRHGVDRLARQLRQHGVSAGNIHGGRSQSQRDRALQVFTEGKVQALVATDVAARGIHVDGVACVAHYDPPADVKDYVHRSGRTARAGAEGMVVSFLDPSQVRDAQKMQDKLGLDRDFEDPVESPNRGARLAGVAKSGPASDTLANKGNKNSGGGKGRGSKGPRGKGAAGKSGPKRSNGRYGDNDSENGEKSRSKAGSGKPRTSKSGSGKPGAAKKSGSGSNSAPSGKKRGGPKKRWAESGGSRSGSDSGSGSGFRSGSGRPKKKSSSGASSSSKPGASKRSGKPRPKNRKNAARSGS